VRTTRMCLHAGRAVSTGQRQFPLAHMKHETQVNALELNYFFVLLQFSYIHYSSRYYSNTGAGPIGRAV
jgi:hypothetical protein